jgi:hypothetical protein
MTAWATQSQTGKRQVQYTLGVVLVTYLIGAGIKKFQEQEEAGVSKELTQMHDMSVFCPVMQEFLSKKSRRGLLPHSCSWRKREMQQWRRKCVQMD